MARDAFVMWLNKLPVVAVVALLLSACATNVPERRDLGEDVSHVYRLGTGDKIRITVYDEASLSGEFPIDAGGAISLPLIGLVPASGKTTTELTQEIRSRLLAGYLRDPRVSIDILTYRPYYILGEVTKPGEYPYSVGLTVLEAVAKAQGFTYRANRRQVYVKHGDSPQEVQITLSTTTAVLPGDTVRIGERYF